MDWGAVIQAASAVATQAAAARAAAAANKAAAQNRVDQTNADYYRTDKTTDLQALTAAANAANARAGGILSENAANLAAPGKRAANSVRGSVLANAQDVQITGLPKGVTMPTITGGLRPSMFSGDTRALGAQMSRQALLDQMAPAATPYTDLKPLDTSSITAMKGAATPLPQPSTLDSILANIGTYGALGSTAAQFLPKPKPAVVTPATFDPATGNYTE